MKQVVAALGLAFLPALAAAQPSIEARRFALVIGVNDGGPSRIRLRYAASDAEEFAQVLQQLGGVAEGDMMLLVDADRSRILSRLEQLGRRLAQARASVRRLDVIVYYSGHSDEEGLLVRGDRIPYKARPGHEAQRDQRSILLLSACSRASATRVAPRLHLDSVPAPLPQTPGRAARRRRAVAAASVHISDEAVGHPKR